ncbi:pirin family protein [Evansella tamaricis]|uniref:Pirin family protein n=1 Tax=Evansella tamaricis TaxID=2069301 RepID=A0ABS6JP22_9BACI|nr:pirin family protein [Evansella tamaricis]MBU9714053.1 pirin family protein [Evansella tamaricis]
MFEANKRNISKKWDVSVEESENGNRKGLILEPGHWSEYDPFLLMAEDCFKRGTFGFHPHRGMETVTYVIDGELEHKDNKGGEGLLRSGDVQWMTAGSGIIHAEEPVEGTMVHTLQLWVNLPSERKMTSPRYQDISKGTVPTFEEKGAKIRLFSGTYKGNHSDTLNHTPITMMEIEMDVHSSCSIDIPSEYNGFIYVLKGSGYFGSNEKAGCKGQVLWLGEASSQTELSELVCRTETEKVKLLLYAGKPIHEPVVAGGPFVMNSEEEIKQAYKDYRDGKFN